tara:strand:- start:429 stop:722 length:294 start_codon:yes stop_codon:yes gene_type:complete
MAFDYEKKVLKIYDEKGKLFLHLNFNPNLSYLGKEAMWQELENDIEYLGNDDCRKLWRFAKSLTKAAYKRKLKIVKDKAATQQMIDDNTIGIGELDK